MGPPQGTTVAPQRSVCQTGGVDTILSEPRYSSHAKMTSEQRTKAGIPDGFMRISIGLEEADDIIADIEQAL